MAKETKAGLFARLTRLMRSGGPVVKRKVRGTQDTRVAVADATRSSGASLFAKSYSNVYNTIIQNAYNMGERLHRYQDFCEMELTAEISAALDLYADETVAQDDKGRTLHVYSNNPKIKEILEDLFYNILNSEFNLRMWTRHLVKYGDLFLYNDVHPQYGIKNVVPIPVAEIERLEGYDKEDPMAVKFKWITVGQRELENWEVTHIRLLGNDMYLPYGTSVLDAARKIWRQLILAEDAMLVYRLCLVGDTRVKTPDGWKYIKDINIGDTVYSYETSGNLVETKVAHWVNNGKKKTYRVCSQHIDFCGTETHPVLVKRSTGNIEYVDIKDLKVGEDCLINANEINLNEKTEISRFFGEEHAILSESQREQFLSMITNETKISLIREICAKHDVKQHQVKAFLYTNGCSLKKEIAEDICFKFDLGSAYIKCNKGEINPTRINLPKYIDEEFAKLFGFLLGDGSIHDTQLHFAAGIDAAQNDYYAKLLEKYFGTVTFEQDKRLSDGLGNYVVSSVVASKVFEQLGYIRGAHNKRIPAWVFKSSKEIRKAFISGLADADASVRENKSGLWKAEFEMCNRLLIEDIKDVWASIGLSTGKIKTRTRAGHEIVEGRMLPTTTSWYVWLSDKKLETYERVTSVEFESEEDVFDITVDNALHNFIANHTPLHNTRAPDRRVFSIDVGNAPPDQVENIMNQAKMGLRTNAVVDRSTGKIDIRNNQMAVDEDFWLPVRGTNSGTKIENLAGGQNTAAVEDIQYLQRKLFAALKVPKAYLGFDEMLSSKATLAQEDIRFSRTINMIQRTIISELNKIAIIHLFAHGYDDEELLDFSLKLSNPSTVAQQQKLELYRTKFDIAANAPEGLLSRNYMLKQVLSMSDDEIERNRQELVEDKLFQGQLDAVSPEGGAGDGTGGDDEGGGGGLFDDAPEGGEEGGEADAGGEEEINAGEDPEEDQPSLSLLTAGDDGDEPMRLNVNLNEKDRPIKASNKSRPKQKWKEKYNYVRRRTSGRGGIDALHMSTDGDPSKTDRADDPYDFKSLKTANPLKFEESFGSANENIIEETGVIVRPSLPNDVKTMLRKAAARWGMVPQQHRTKLISEEVSSDDLDINIEKDE